MVIVTVKSKYAFFILKIRLKNKFVLIYGGARGVSKVWNRQEVIAVYWVYGHKIWCFWLLYSLRSRRSYRQTVLKTI